MIVQLFIIFYGIPELGRLVTGNADEQWTLSSVLAIPFKTLLVEIRINAVNKAIIKPKINVTIVIGIEYNLLWYS
jgi:hypothetical protein